MTEHDLTCFSISRKRERDRKSQNSGLNTQTDTQTEKPQSDLLGSLQEPKMRVLVRTYKDLKLPISTNSLQS